MSGKTTNQFSFVLKPSKHGIGVFATEDIPSGAHLRVFGDDKVFAHRYRVLNVTEVPLSFREYCIERGDTLICPPDFGAMPLGWHMNHSNNPNAVRGPNDDPNREYQWYALRNINAGEEILIDYNSLDEPEESKKAYYEAS
jgi:hypothetical protein